MQHYVITGCSVEIAVEQQAAEQPVVLVGVGPLLSYRFPFVDLRITSEALPGIPQSFVLCGQFIPATKKRLLADLGGVNLPSMTEVLAKTLNRIRELEREVAVLRTMPKAVELKACRSAFVPVVDDSVVIPHKIEWDEATRNFLKNRLLVGKQENEEASLVQSEIVNEPQSDSCSCSTASLMTSGCTCGFFSTERKGD